MKFNTVPFLSLLENIVDNRGKTCPTSESGIPLIATNCVLNTRLYPVFEKVRYVDKETYHTWFRGHPEPGDMLFVTKGTPGRVCWVPDPVNFCIAQDMVAIKANKELVYPKYLFALLRASTTQKSIENMQVGTLIPHFKKGDFDKLELPIPTSYEVQEKVGDLYFDICEKIELDIQINFTLEAIAQVIFKHWFVDFNFTNSEVEKVESEMGMIPKGWKSGKLKDVCQLTRGVSYKSEELESSNTALVTLKSINRGGGLNFNGFKEYVGRFKPSQILDEGDLIFAQTDITQNADVVGSPAIVENPFDYENLVASLDIVKCKAINEMPSNEVLFHFLKRQEFKDYCLSHTNGSTVLHLRTTEVPNYPLVIPEEKILKKFDLIVKPIRREIICNNRQSELLGSIRDSLLPKLMSGEIEV
jgi:type I restriction enzyme, S subunit